MDPYGILGLPTGATLEEVQRAYRRLARRWHPDVNPDPEARARFAELAAAYEALRERSAPSAGARPVEVVIHRRETPRSFPPRRPPPARPQWFDQRPLAALFDPLERQSAPFGSTWPERSTGVPGAPGVERPPGMVPRWLDRRPVAPAPRWLERPLRRSHPRWLDPPLARGW